MMMMRIAFLRQMVFCWERRKVERNEGEIVFAKPNRIFDGAEDNEKKNFPKSIRVVKKKTKKKRERRNDETTVRTVSIPALARP